MQGARGQIIDWAGGGFLSVDRISDATRIASVEPTGDDWRRFISNLLLWTGSLLLSAGIIFFFAYNWGAIGRLQKLALAESALLTAVAVTWFLGLDKRSGRAALLTCTLLTGATLAVFGQVYQTGADSYQMFGVWAALIVPWTLSARQPWLWLIWIGLVDVAFALYFGRRPGRFDIIFGLMGATWVLLAFNTAALVVWEVLAAGPLAWLRSTLARRLLAVVGGSCASVLAFWGILASHKGGGIAVLVYVFWMSAAFWYSRFRTLDLFVLAAGVLSAIVIVVAGLTRVLLFNGGHAPTLLFISLVAIGLSAVGAVWLKRLNARSEL